MALRTDFEITNPSTSTSDQQVSLVETAEGSAYSVPLGSFILDADYARDGQDLVLKDDFGREVTLDGYFQQSELLPLQNEFGAKVLGGFVAKLAGPGQVAQAGATSAALGDPVGTVENIEGNATVQHKDGTSEKLEPGSNIYQDDIIETDGSGNVGILLNDGAIMGVGPGSRMTIDSFVYDEDTNDGSVGLSFLKGAVSFVSGKIAKNDYEDVNIKVPYGSIGIRGTEFVVDTADNGVATVFVLGGRVITVTGNQEEILTPGQLISIAAAGLTPLQELTLLQIQQQFQSVIEIQEQTRTIRDGRAEVSDDELNVEPAAGGNQNSDGEGDAEGEGEEANLQRREENLDLDPFDPNLVATNVDGLDISVLFNVPLVSGAPGFPGTDTDLLPPSLGGVVFIGTEVDDTFTGTAFGDLLIGNGDNDTLSGGAGNDEINGGAGDDALNGDGGDDTIDGGIGNDILQGGEGSVDILRGGVGDDLIYGDNAIDPDPTTGDDDTLYGEDGNDTLYGGGGQDLMFGGDGNDLLAGGFGSDLLDGGAGDDIAQFAGNVGDYRILAFGDQFSVQDTDSGEIDLINDIETLRFEEGDFSLVSFSLAGDENTAEEGVATYQLELNGAVLQEGQSASVGISLTDIETSSSDYQTLISALQQATEETPGVVFSASNDGYRITFYGGEGNATALNFSLQIPNDYLGEAAEKFAIQINSPSGAGGDGNGVVSVIAAGVVVTEIEDGIIPTPDWQITGANSSPVPEGSSTEFQVSYTGADIVSGSNFSVEVKLELGEAEAADFSADLEEALSLAADLVDGVTAVGNRLYFDENAPSTFTFALPTALDGLAEANETFSVTLQNPEVNDASIGTISQGEHQVTIADGDEVLVSLNGDAIAPEGGSSEYTISLNGSIPSGESISVDVSILNDGTTGDDYGDLVVALEAAAASTPGVSVSGTTVTFSSSASEFTFELPVGSGDGVEVAEQFAVQIENVSISNGAAISIDGPAAVTTAITEGDSISIGFTEGLVSKVEGQAAAYTIMVSGLALGLTALPAGAEISFELDLNHVTSGGDDIAETLAAALSALPEGVEVSVEGSSAVIQITDTAVFTDGSLALSFDLELTAGDTIEPTEAFTLDISSLDGTGVAVSGGTVQVTTEIIDDGIDPNAPTPFDDVLVGTEDADFIDALAGNDFVQGAAGNDTLLGNSGADTLHGDSGFDSLVGGTGNDILVGGSGNDTLEGGVGDDFLNGGGDTDYLSGDNGNDILLGGGSRDFLTGGRGDDVLDGQAGNDVLEGGAGDDRYFLRAGGGADTAIDMDGNDELYVDGFERAERVGDDAIFYHRDGGQITIQNYGTTSTITFGSLLLGDQVSHFELLKGLTGTLENDLIIGSDAGLEVLTGGFGDDLLFGGDGNDRLLGDFGDDSLLGEAGNDVIIGGFGFDRAFYNGSHQTEGVHVDLSVGEAFNDGFGDHDEIYDIEGVVGGDMADTLRGDALDNEFIGGGGNDIIQGGGGDDTIEGGTGNNELQGGAGYDTVSYLHSSTGVTITLSGEVQTAVHNGGDIDTLSGFEKYIGSSFNDVMSGNGQEQYLVGYDGDDNVSGGAGNDTIDGGNGADTLDGGTGYDLLDNQYSSVGVELTLSDDHSGTLVQGSDTSTFENFERYSGSHLDDVLTGAWASDNLAGNQGNDTLDGGGGFDFLQGNEDNDILVGGGGNDTLVGGDGFDTMTGGGDTDFFDYDAQEDGTVVASDGIFNGEHDEITDFQTGQDILFLAASEFGFEGGFDQEDDFVSTIGGQAYDGTNADLSGDINTGEAKLIFDGTYLYYDEDLESEGYTVIAEISSGTVTGDDVIVGGGG